MKQKQYTQKYDWEIVDETKGWENPNLRDDLHKVAIVEKETGNKNRQIFNFTPKQTSGTRWKKHVDLWIERIQETEKKSLT